MIRKSLISVVMSVYNGAEYIEETIDSILTQEYKEIEFIIIDDASTDNTLEKIKKYTDKRIVLVKNKENRKLAYNLNEGIRMAKGKYVARIDADDICMPKRFVTQIAYLEKHLEVMIVGGYAQLFGDSNYILKYPLTYQKIKVGLLFENCMCHPAVTFRNKKEIFYYDVSFKASQDYELWSRLIWQIQFINIPQVMIKYRVHKRQTKYIMKKEQNSGAIKARIAMFQKLMGETEEEVRILFLEGCNYHQPKDSGTMEKINQLFFNMLVKNREVKLFNRKNFEQWIGNLFIQNFYISYKNNRVKIENLRQSHFVRYLLRKPKIFVKIVYLGIIKK